MRIISVKDESFGSGLGLEKGDEIIEFNDYKAVDILDYEFFDAKDEFTVTVKKSGGIIEKIKVKKGGGETLGLSFSDDGFKVLPCRNRCVFCFVDQLPPLKSLRKTLRVKDDDYRHSFLFGNYVTLTNLTSDDKERIKRLKLSPLYVSVHSSDEKVRSKLLGVRDAAPILPILREFNGAGIKIHAQIVYCPGINDDIEKTAYDIMPYTESLAIVPVGLTRYKNPEVRAVNATEANNIINTVERLQKKFIGLKGTRYIFAADEFYIKAKRDMPTESEYEGYPQIENGVGLIRSFEGDFEYALSSLPYREDRIKAKFREVSIATGVSSYPFISKKAQELTDKFGVKIYVYAVINKFFGETVTVSGLVTGGDILETLKDKELGQVLLIPSVMLRENGDEFLDNTTLFDIKKTLGVDVKKIYPDGGSFVYAVLNLEQPEED